MVDVRQQQRLLSHLSEKLHAGRRLGVDLAGEVGVGALGDHLWGEAPTQGEAG